MFWFAVSWINVIESTFWMKKAMGEKGVGFYELSAHKILSLENILVKLLNKM